ncbi:MAG: hypothetical protein HY675_14600 [Chloroflexi bacterium]|nr:hypothetical protein [Chloroflexota bacterium]
MKPSNLAPDVPLVGAGFKPAPTRPIHLELAEIVVGDAVPADQSVGASASGGRPGRGGGVATILHQEQVAVENDATANEALIAPQGVEASRSTTEPTSEETIARYWPAFAVKDAVVASLVTVAVVLLAIFMVPRQVVTDPIYRTAVPSPDWLYLFYLMPYMYLRGIWQLPALLAIPPIGILLLILVPFVQRGGAGHRRRRAHRMVVLALVALFVGGLLVAVARTGASVPIQGCESCHRARMVGAPPTDIKSFGRRDSQWISKHLVDPQYWWMQ